MSWDVSELTLIGQGRHGKVYKLDGKSCVKLYRKRSYLQMEFEALKNTAQFSYFPKVYECKDNYMLREYFEGPNLLEYLRQNKFNRNIAAQLLGIIEAFLQIGYSRIDCRLPHIIVTADEQLRIIDPTRNKSKEVTYPKTLLKELNGLGLRDSFLAYVKELRPDFYQNWVNELGITTE